MIWNETKECMSRDEMSALQSARLRKTVNHVYHNVEFYRKKMQKIGLEPGDINGIEDITKLPYTTKDDLRDNYPFGLFAVPQSEVVRIHASSGTTGKATIVGYTRRDIEIWSECVARVLTMAGIQKNDIPDEWRIGNMNEEDYNKVFEMSKSGIITSNTSVDKLYELLAV